MYSTARKLLKKTETGKRPVRLLGISMTGLSPDSAAGQLSLFTGNEKKDKSDKLNRAIDSVHDRFGKKSVVPGRLLS